MRVSLRIAIFLAALAVLAALPAQAGAWDREVAKSYAEQYALSYNSAFTAYSGNDCTNFVSQSIWYGGIGMDQDWFYNFAYYFGSGYWINADLFHNYFKESYRTHNYRYLLGTYDFHPDSSRPRPPRILSTMVRGDIISYDWDLFGGSDWTMNHVAIVTGKNAHSTLDWDWQGDLTCQHSDDYYRVAWQGGDRYSSTDMRNWGFAAWGLLTSLW